jgi:PPP family 3-phenylpropionic acid transporter
MPERKDIFPIRLFLLYILFYSGQAVYQTYINLYMADTGLVASQIGLIVSVSTLFTLGAQFIWGVLSDRASSKNLILLILYASAAVVLMLFYAGTQVWLLMLLVTLFSMIFNPIVPLQDNLMLETLEGGRWDYGQVRLGGTVGYCLTVLVIGIVLRDEYRHIFWITSIMMLICFAVALRLNKVSGHRSKTQKTPYRALLKNKALLAVILFNLCFSLGSNMYYSYYPIYFTSIGGDSSLIGIMMFISAASEIPVLFIINRVVRRLGTGKVLIFAGLATSLRWFLLFFLSNPVLILAASLLHGVGFIAFTYCIVTYISATVPRDLRATSQTFNVLIGSIFSRVIFGYLGGLASDTFGTNNLMLVSGIVMATATLVFAVWLRARGNALLALKQGEDGA